MGKNSGGFFSRICGSALSRPCLTRFGNIRETAAFSHHQVADVNRDCVLESLGTGAGLKNTDAYITPPEVLL